MILGEFGPVKFGHLPPQTRYAKVARIHSLIYVLYVRQVKPGSGLEEKRNVEGYAGACRSRLLAVQVYSAPRGRDSSEQGPRSVENT